MENLTWHELNDFDQNLIGLYSLIDDIVTDPAEKTILLRKADKLYEEWQPICKKGMNPPEKKKGK